MENENSEEAFPAAAQSQARNAFTKPPLGEVGPLGESPKRVRSELGKKVYPGGIPMFPEALARQSPGCLHGLHADGQRQEPAAMTAASPLAGESMASSCRAL